MNEIQTSLSEARTALTLESLNLRRTFVRSYDIPVQYSEPRSSTDDIEYIVSCTKNFNNEQQQNVFNTILGEILPGDTFDNTGAPVQRPFEHYSQLPRAYFLDAPGCTGKTFAIRAMQSMLRLRKHKVIAVTISAVAASLLEDGR